MLSPLAVLSGKHLKSISSGSPREGTAPAAWISSGTPFAPSKFDASQQGAPPKPNKVVLRKSRGSVPAPIAPPNPRIAVSRQV